MRSFWKIYRKKIYFICFSTLVFIGLFISIVLENNISKQSNKDINNAEDEIYNFLVIGQDDAANLCDVIVIVSYNTTNQRIEALQIPRDTYASYTSSSYRKLNGAVHSLGGVENFIKFIEDNLGIPIDYYLMTDLEAVTEAVDKIGGVEVDIPEDMVYNDPYQNLYINLKAGRHTLNGKQATSFLRYRSGYVRGDIGRLDAQKIFIASLIKKVITDLSIYDMANLAMLFLDKVETNLKYNDCLNFILQIKDIKMYNIAFSTIPGEDVQTPSGAWYYIINREQAYNIIKNYFSSELNETEFDKNKYFTSNYRDSFNEIYNARDKYEIIRYKANEICQNGINID